MVDTSGRFTSRAVNYARYRWNYPPNVGRDLFAALNLPPDCTVVDAGSGTGFLTRHLLPYAGRVYALEPNAEMRAQAERSLGDHPNFHSLAGYSFDSGLPAASVDLVTVGQALHWFEAQPTRAEFRRILRAPKWLALVWNEAQDSAFNREAAALERPDLGWHPDPGSTRPAAQPAGYYFAGEPVLECAYPRVWQQDWETTFGALCSDSHAPLEDHPLFEANQAALKEVFDRHAVNGKLEMRFTTRLVLGKME
jgi:SAM-dependent methyltransferase